MKIKNNSKKVKNFKVEGGWLALEPGESTDLPACVLSNEKDVEAVVVDSEEPKEEALAEPKEPEAAPEPPAEVASEEQDKPLKYSKSGLKFLNEDEQVALLKQYGESEESIKSLNKESKRVKRLLKLQDENE